jgi:uncharacterized protein
MAVHVFKTLGKYIALDIPSGVIHEVDEIVATFIKELNNNKSIEDLKRDFAKTQLDEEIMDELSELMEQELLFTEEIITEYSPKLEDTVTKALCLHIAHDCNMRCSYCFADSGEYKVGKREMMSEDIALSAVDYLISSSDNRHNLEIDFFGGEPLLNFETVKQTVLYARKKEKQHDKNIRFSLTTNGLLLDDEKIDFIIKHDIQLIMSHDGRPEAHNKMRPLVGGQESYKKVTKNFLKAINKGVDDYHIRGTFTKYNKDFTEDVKHIIDLGFSKISFEPVVADPCENYALREADLQDIKNEYDELAKFYIEKHENNKPFTFFHYEMDLNQGPCLAKRLTGCGAGYDYLAVAPNGDLYPCHQFVGLVEFRMGNVKTEGYNKDIAKVFIEAHILNKEECKDCFAKFYCSGGCHADAYFRNGDLLKPNHFSCELSRKRIENALAIKANLYER